MRQRARAFTLIELLVVIVLLGILVSVAVLSVGGSSTSRELRDEARRLAALIGVLSDEAVLDSREYGLLVNSEGYRVLRYDEAATRWLEVERRKVHKVPDWMRLDLELDGTPLELVAPTQREDDRAGLSGRVLEVYPKFSKVLLLTNSAASAVCAISPGGLEALVEGKGTWLLKMNYVPEEASVEAGSELLTSPGGLLFPAGISVGKVTKVYPRESFMNFITADVAPAVDVNTLKEVFVVRRNIPGDLTGRGQGEKK